MDPGDSAVSLSLDDLTHFGPPLGGPSLPGSHDHSFEDGAASFLSGTDLSHDAFDLVGGDNTSDGLSRRTPSLAGPAYLRFHDRVFRRKWTLSAHMSDMTSFSLSANLPSLHLFLVSVISSVYFLICVFPNYFF